MRIPGILKGALALVAVIIVIAVFGLLLIRPQQFAPKVAAILENRLSSDTLQVSFTSPTLSYRSFAAQQLRIFWPRVPSWIDLQDLRAVLPVRCLFRLSPCVDFEGSAYKGVIDGTVVPLAGGATITSRVTDIMLGEHPAFGSLGIRGVLSASAGNFSVSSSSVDGEIKTSVTQGEKSTASRYNLRAFGLPFEIEIPAFEQLQIDIAATCAGTVCELKDGTLTSSLGNAEVSGTLEPFGRRNLNLTGSVRLTSAGSSSIGQWLPVFSGGRLQATTKQFFFTLRGPSGAARVSFSLAAPK